MTATQKKLRKNSLAADVVYYAVLVVAALIIVIPFVWMVATSFDYVKTYGLPYPPRFIPENPSLFNYVIAVKNMPVIQYMSNTLIITVVSAGFNVLIASLAGYCISVGNFKGKSIVLFFILSNMMIPFETKLMPIYQTISRMGLANTHLGVVLPGVLTSAIYIFFVKKYCDDLPGALYEAGIIDGANKLKIYWRIYLPLMGPAIATIAVLSVIASWNDLLWPMVVLTRPEMKTIQIGLAQYSTDTAATHAGVATALSVISTIPMVCVFVFLQRYIVQSIAASGIKQ